MRSSLWRRPDFLRLWSGRTVSLFGTGLGALPFTALFLLDAGPAEMAVLGAATLAPGLLVGLAAGVWVDRRRRRSIMVAADLGRALLLASLLGAALADALTFAHLCAVAFATGILALAFDVAALAHLPSLVATEDLTEANAKLAASEAVAEAGSFSVGGWIVQLVSARAALAVDAVSFLVSGALIAAIATPEPVPPPPAADGSTRSMAADIGEGLRALRADPVLRAVGLSAAARDFAYGVIGSVILVYATRQLGFRPGVLGLIFAVGGVSSLVGAALSRRLAERVGRGRAMVAGLLLSGLSTLFLPLAPGAAAAGVACLVAQQLLGDAGSTVYEVTSTTTRQSRIGAPIERCSRSLRCRRDTKAPMRRLRRRTCAHWFARSARSRRRPARPGGRQHPLRRPRRHAGRDRRRRGGGRSRRAAAGAPGRQRRPPRRRRRPTVLPGERAQRANRMSTGPRAHWYPATTDTVNRTRRARRVYQ